MPTIAAPSGSRVTTVAKYAAAVLLTLTWWVVTLPDVAASSAPPALRVAEQADLLLGLAALALLPLRRRHPLAVSIALSTVLLASASALGAWSFAAVSLGKRRHVSSTVLVLTLATATSLVYELWFPYTAPGEETISWWIMGAIVALLYSLVFAVGFYLGARQDLLDSLRDRAETAEREQHSRAAQARAAERARIAREMHDVLAHRISTVAMHSGALAYRTDLTPEEVSGAARLIQENAHSALVELRDILGVLRQAPGGEDAVAVSGAAAAPEPPQPTIGDLDALVADAVAAGQDVTLHLDIDPGEIPGPLGRHVYRSVQECLTNARKHAPGAPVEVRVDHRPASGSARGSSGRGDLVVEVSNPLRHTGAGAALGPHGLFTAIPAEGDATGVPAPATPPTSGVGLLGLTERAELAGGHLDHGPENGRYRTRLVVPWPERSSV